MALSAELSLDQHLLAQALLIRRVEQRLLQLFAQGKLFGTVHTCVGQEWTGPLLVRHLHAGDQLFSNHRCHGHYLAYTDDVEGLIAEIMGKQSGMCGGRGGSQHICSSRFVRTQPAASPTHPLRAGFFSNGIQGSIVPVAAGLACVHKLAKSDAIAVVCIGDGTLGEGVVYETMNLAAQWELPLLIVLEHNLYAQSTHHTQTLAGDVEARAAAFGIKTTRANHWDLAHCDQTLAHAVAEVRTHGRPLLVRLDTYRLNAHSKGDDDRSSEEVEAYRKRDWLTRIEGEGGAELTAMLERIERRIDAAVAAAEAAPFPSLVMARPAAQNTAWKPAVIEGNERCVARIHDALGRNMRRDARIVLIGEDIEGPYGGAFKVTRNLSHEFPGRVRNTPISEAAIAGMGCGLALNGMVPVCELMFGDFVMLAADQIVNGASKFRFMYNDQVRVPMVLRMPMGARRGYGPTHSQSLEKHFLGLPDLRVLALNRRVDPGQLYDRLFADIEGPSLVIENKLLYGERIEAEAPPGFVIEHTDGDFPWVRMRPAAGEADLLILCYGEMLRHAEEAAIQLFEQHEIAAQVLCPTQLFPFDLEPLAQAFAACKRMLIAEEGLGFAAFGAETLAQLAERTGIPPGSVTRLSAPCVPIPASGPLERELLPDAAAMVRAGRALMEGGR